MRFRTILHGRAVSAVCLGIAVLLLLTPVAASTDVEEQATENRLDGPTPSQPLSYLDLSVGGSSAGGDASPYLCLYANPWWRLAFTACGTGSEIWRRGSTNEISTYLGHLRLTRWRAGNFFVAPYLGAGFAEFQLADDVPGFSFNGPQENRGQRVSVSGPAAMLMTRFAYSLPHRLEAVSTLGMGVGHFARAPELQVPGHRLQPFVQLLMGIGF